MLRKLLIALGILVALVGLVTLIEDSRPVAHTASRTASLTQPADRVYVVLTDVQSYPQWRSDVKTVEDLAASPRRWREHLSYVDLTFEVVEANPPGRLVTRIADPDLPFGGSWTYELARGHHRHASVDHRARRSLQPCLPIHVALRVRPHRDDGPVSCGFEEARRMTRPRARSYTPQIRIRVLLTFLFRPLVPLVGRTAYRTPPLTSAD